MCSAYLIVELKTTLILFLKGRNLTGIDAHVFLPINTTFCLAEEKKYT